MDWINFDEDDFETYPKEGIEVIVSDGSHYDVAWYLASSTYVWKKNDLIADDCKEFVQFKIIKWAYITKD